MVRKAVEVRTRGARACVVADVCGACGERYYGVDAMHALAAAGKRGKRRRAA
jgi:hypothetical protein